jgi:hypothetical protein
MTCFMYDVMIETWSNARYLHAVQGQNYLEVDGLESKNVPEPMNVPEPSEVECNISTSIN